MRVAQVQITKRHVRAMCAQSEGVRHLDGERVQARCVVATTALPHSCRVGRALLLPGRHLGWGEGTPSVACAVRDCIVAVASASCRSHLHTYHGNILLLGPIKAPRAGVMGRVVWTSRFRDPSMVTEGVLGGTPAPAGSWSRDW